VILEPHCGVLGPVKVGNRVRVGAAVIVSRDVPDDAFVEGPRPRLLAQRHSS
jgi:serine acetyltransferase